MQVFYNIIDILFYLNSKRKDKKSIGIIPTMGALHGGHISLLWESKKENDLSIVTIFVNPIQFTNTIDLELYPKDLQKDSEYLEKSGCDILFAPSVTDMYRCEVKTTMTFGRLDSVLEGASRPGHFSGVGIILAKLFNIIQPTKAYFGSKDLQQVAVVKQLVKDLSFQTTIVSCPIIRESDGLAMSSRNQRISFENRTEVAKIFKSLTMANHFLKSNTVQQTKNMVNEFFHGNSILKLEYFEIIDSESFLEIENIAESSNISLCMAIYCKDVRLIDNITFSPK